MNESFSVQAPESSTMRSSRRLRHKRSKIEHERNLIQELNNQNDKLEEDILLIENEIESMKVKIFQKKAKVSEIKAEIRKYTSNQNEMMSYNFTETFNDETTTNALTALKGRVGVLQKNNKDMETETGIIQILISGDKGANESAKKFIEEKKEELNELKKKIKKATKSDKLNSRTGDIHSEVLANADLISDTDSASDIAFYNSIQKYAEPQDIGARLYTLERKKRDFSDKLRLTQKISFSVIPDQSKPDNSEDEDNELENLNQQIREKTLERDNLIYLNQEKDKQIREAIEKVDELQVTLSDAEEKRNKTFEKTELEQIKIEKAYVQLTAAQMKRDQTFGKVEDLELKKAMLQNMLNEMNYLPDNGSKQILQRIDLYDRRCNQISEKIKAAQEEIQKRRQDIIEIRKRRDTLNAAKLELLKLRRKYMRSKMIEMSDALNRSTNPGYTQSDVDTTNSLESRVESRERRLTELQEECDFLELTRQLYASQLSLINNRQ
ncbi:hypothetical protein TVAG_446760 [Trichomonas vaginalis G3]|uniref:DUF4201 domain-containing protein n=1 Tax=Trichomonas vaginalis (strain ATCC PRA-98 / G3) TaxID=412133 RepID=A2E8N5_TRIV3|nr:hypothetical protein TVAGG3_0343830 [Trichomonas vaginalis G3]EAY10974.1 hypothetical protein TVAG_446760 [Trichomonas vaginalis G3]KAI5530825.1 hypothetical protein TVAGG3_0343830 [Trichomonas vaginalis G3]|eukprot:XP_001323197.1 hypothetical protein [Trichomonas vaginalis G3]